MKRKEFDAKDRRKARPCPIWVDAFVKDTLQNSPAEVGSYILILLSMWNARDVSLPDDDVVLARVARVHLKTWRRTLGPMIRDFLKVEDGRIFSPRLRQEAEVVEAFLTAQHVRGKSPKRDTESTFNADSQSSLELDNPLKDNEQDTAPAIAAGTANLQPIDSSLRKSPLTRDGPPIVPLAGPDELTFRERLLVACGVHPMQPRGNVRGRALGDPSDMATASRYLAAGLSEGELVQIFADAAQRKSDGPPNSFAYFEQPVRRYLAARDAAPPEPMPGHVNGSRPSKPAPERVDVREALNGKPH